jgi:hypothetical protein
MEQRLLKCLLKMQQDYGVCDMKTFTKQPYEKYPVSMDFTNILGTDSIVSCDVIAMDNTKDVTSNVIDGTSIDGKKVIVIVKEGTSDTKYDISFRIETSSGCRFEEDVFMMVKEVV